MELADLLDTTMELVSGKWGLSAALQAKAALGGSAIQPDHLGALPVEKFTPGSVALTDSNIVAAIEAARVYAVSKQGGAVVIPLGPHAGYWNIPAGTTIPSSSTLNGQKAGVLFSAADGRNTPLWLMGAPGAGLKIPAECSVGLYFHSPGGVGEAVHTLSGASRLLLRPATSNQTTHGFRANACVRCAFDTIDASAFDGNSGGNHGSGFRFSDDWPGGGGNSQMCLISNLQAGGNANNFDMREIQGLALGLNSQFANNRDMLISAGCDMTFMHGSFQSYDLSTYIELFGSFIVTFIQNYWEGGNVSPSAHGTVFKVDDDLGSSSNLTVIRHRSQSTFDTFMDLGNGYCDVLVSEARGLSYCGKVVKSTAASSAAAGLITFVNSDTTAADAVNPSKFDLTPSAAAKLRVDRGGESYTGGRNVFAVPAQLAALAQGSEGSSPSAGEINHNTTSDRPRYRSATRHHDVAYVDDGQTLRDLLKPYAIELIDPAVYTKRTIVSNELSQIVGLVHGSVGAPVNSSRRPTWHASDEAFGGKPSFECVNASDRMITMPLASSLATGKRASLFVVARATGTVPTGGPRRRILNADTVSYTLLGADGDKSDGWWAINGLSSVGGQSATFTGAVDANPHIFYAGARPDDSLRFRLSVDGVIGSGDPPTLDQGVTTDAVAKVYIGAFSEASGQSADVAIAFLALLDTPLPPSIAERAIAMAGAQYGIAL